MRILKVLGNPDITIDVVGIHELCEIQN